MLEIAVLTQILAITFFIIVGVRLLLLSRKTGELPEKLLGIYFFLTGVSYIGWLSPTLFPLEGAAAYQADLATWTLYSIGVLPFIIFTRIAFRPTDSWAKWLAVAISASLFSGMFAWIAQGQGYYTLENSWFWAQWLGYTCLLYTSPSPRDS